MAAKFRKIDPRIWHDEGFVKLSSDEKLVAFYCLTAQVNRIGLFQFSPAKAAEDLETLPQTFAKRFGNVCHTLNWGFDSARKTLYFPSWWKYNLPDNPNAFKGALDDLHDIPETPLKSAFLENTRYLPETYAERLPKRMANVTPNVTPNVSPQEKEKEKEKEKSKARPRRRVVLEPEIPSEMDTPEFHLAWDRWAKYQRERGKWPPSTQSAQMQKLRKIGAARAIVAIDFSISQGWQGIYEPRHGMADHDDPPEQAEVVTGFDRIRQAGLDPYAPPAE